MKYIGSAKTFLHYLEEKYMPKKKKKEHLLNSRATQALSSLTLLSSFGEDRVKSEGAGP